MPSVLFLAVHRPGRAPCQRFRFEQYLPFLEQNGYTCEFSWLLNAEDDRRMYSTGNTLAKAAVVLKSVAKRLGQLLKKKQYDIIFVQRECIMLGTSFFERNLKKSGAKMIFDFDDSIWLQNVSEANKRFTWLKNPAKTKDLIQLADLVFAGNRFLADYALQFNEKVEIVPTTIDCDLYKPAEFAVKPSPNVCIGWSGSITTIQHFEFAIPFLKKIKTEFQDAVRFEVIGDGNYANDELQIKGRPWRAATELEDLKRIDIGIMPLPDDQWASGKCGLKGLQYMALGIPTIMSPVGVNSQIISDGTNGFLAKTTAEWVEKLSALLKDQRLRNRIGEAGRQTVVDRYSVQALRKRYLKLFESLTESC